ncbi:MAG: C10 family peptidase [Bacteroidales bacterium]|nr:C10 family peptidase [Bacteroidales bacterium]
MKKKPIILAMSFLGLLAVSCSREYFPAHDDGPAPTTPYRYGIRSAGEAVSIAQESLDRFYPGTKSEKGKEVSCIIPYVSASTKGTASDTLFYIVNFGENEGFALINTDPAVAPLLVITEEGHYEGRETENTGFNLYMDNLVTQLSSRFSGGPILPPIDYNYLDTLRYTDTQKTPLLQSAWGQNGPFAELTPNHYPAGCTPIAIGQIMAYYQHPDTVQLKYPGASPSYITPAWANMAAHNSHDTEQCSICLMNARFIREVGRRLQTLYGTQSGTTMDGVDQGLPALGYTHSAASSYSPQNVLAAVDLNRPVLAFASFQGSNGGHTWVIDGYQFQDRSIDYYRFVSFNLDGSLNLVYGGHDEETCYYFHFNLGQGGEYNGYYISYHYVNQTGIIFPTPRPDTVLIDAFAEDLQSGIPNHNRLMIYDMLPNN